MSNHKRTTNTPLLSHSQAGNETRDYYGYVGPPYILTNGGHSQSVLRVIKYTYKYILSTRLTLYPTTITACKIIVFLNICEWNKLLFGIQWPWYGQILTHILPLNLMNIESLPSLTYALSFLASSYVIGLFSQPWITPLNSFSILYL